MVKSENKPCGYIYVATNRINDKVYVGQTRTSRWGDDKIPIEERWNKEIKDAYSKKRRGEKLRYVENAIIKYGRDNFDLKEVDIAYNQEKLNTKERKWIKDLDAMNPDKGYNMTEGGEGGKASPELREYLSKIGLEKWQNDSEYREKQTQERRERAKNPEWIEKMTRINREITQKPGYKEKMSKIMKEKAKDPEWRKNVSKGLSEKYQKDPKWRDKMKRDSQERGKDPKFREKVSNAITKKWDKDPEYRKKQENERKERAKDPNFINKMREIGKQYRKEISDKRQFLNDIKNNMYKKDMLEKYNMGKHAFNKRIQEMFGPNGPKNYTELKDYLQDKNINDVLKEIEEREAEERGDKLETEEDTEKSEEKDKESSEDRDSPEEKEDEIGEKDQAEEAEGEKEKSIEEEKDDEIIEEESSEGQVAEPKDPSIGSSPDEQDEADDQQENQTMKTSDNLSKSSPEVSHQLSFPEKIMVPSPDGKGWISTDELAEIRDKKDKKHSFTSGREYDGNKMSMDYNGFDQSKPDKGEDFKGIDEYNDDDSAKDYDRLDDFATEKGSDFDGIDSLQEKMDKDYNDIDEGCPEGNVESGGEP